MEGLNRLFVVAIGAILTVTSAAVLLVDVGSAAPQTLTPAGWLRDGLVYVQNWSGMDALWGGAAAGVVGVLSMLLIIAELRPVWHKERFIILDTEGERFELNPRSIETIVQHEGSRMTEVISIKPHVRRNSRGLVVACDAMLQSSARMPDTAERLRRQLAEMIQRMTGLHVDDLKLRVKFAPGQQRRVV